MIWLLLIAVAAQNCTVADQRFFQLQKIDQDYPIIPNPYDNPSEEYLKLVNDSLHNKKQVCALRYLDGQHRRYEQKTFQSNISAVEAGWTVTHQGRCAACSTAQDLWVYLTTDLTRPVRKCGIQHFHSHSALKKCISNLGFTDACTEVWLWNTINTKKHCGLVCMYALFTKRPFVKPDGQLNRCLQCDQDISGPIFKYESGRTRRNSGIHSEIDRPDDQIYNMTHCYF